MSQKSRTAKPKLQAGEISQGIGLYQVAVGAGIVGAGEDLPGAGSSIRNAPLGIFIGCGMAAMGWCRQSERIW